MEQEGVGELSQETRPEGAMPKLVAHGTMPSSEFEAKFRDREEHVEAEEGEATGVFVLDINLAPGGHTGWHTHDGIEIVTVKSGTLTVFDDSNPCAGEDFGPGQSFMWQGPYPNHDARNLGDSDVNVNVVFLVPPGGATRIDLPAPEGADDC